MLAILCLIFACYCHASSPEAFPCEASAGIQAELDSIRSSAKNTTDRMLLWKNLVKKYPEDLFVHRSYQDEYKYYSRSSLPQLVAEYQALSTKHPEDPKFLYLYGRPLGWVGKKKDAVHLYSRALTVNPNFYWAHLALSQYYAREKNVQLKHHVTETIRLCPRSWWSYNYAHAVKDPGFVEQTAAKIRAMLNEDLSSSNVEFFRILWILDFKITPVERHVETRKRIAEDLQRLRENPVDDLNWWMTLQQGYQYLGDPQEVSRIAQEISVRYPEESYDMVSQLWYESNRRQEPQTDQKEYDRKFLEVTSEWIQKWPDNPWAWFDRLGAVAADDVPLTEVKKASEQLLRLLKENPEGLITTHDIYVVIAIVHTKRNLDLDGVPALLDQANQAWNQYAETAFPRGEPESEQRRQEHHHAFQWRYLSTLAKWHQKKNELEEFEKVLGRMETLTKTDRNGRISREYWQLKGDLAKARQNEKDAAKYYARAKESIEVKLKEVNDPLPDFDLSDLSGKKWQLADLKGKVVYINVWATWCGGCQMELPLVERLYQELKDRPDVLVLTLNRDDHTGIVEPYMKENRFSFPVLMADGYVEQVHPEVGIPQNWIVDAEGNIRLFSVGSLDHQEDFVKRVHALIDQYKPTK